MYVCMSLIDTITIIYEALDRQFNNSHDGD